MPEARWKVKSARDEMPETNKPIKRHEDLLVYRKSYQLALEMHTLSLKFPDFEKWELGRQLREASKSISVNIAEG